MRLYFFVACFLSTLFSLTAQSIQQFTAGDTSLFERQGVSRWQLNAPAQSDVSWMSVAIPSGNHREWRFWARMDFAPSGSNFLKVYLAVDAPDLEGNANGYFLKIGESGSQDAIELYRQDGVSETLLLRGTDGLFANPLDSFQVKVVQNGQWEVFVDVGQGWQSQGTYVDNSHENLRWSGFSCHYTSTRSTLFWFGDLEVEELTAVNPPVFEPYSVLIHEVMANPSPAIGLPEAEYVELYNRSADTIDLQGWVFTDGTTNFVLPAHALAPQELILLCDEQDASFFSGNVISGDFPSINNDRERLRLLDNQGNEIHAIEFDASWYGDADKDEGGWSLEMVNPENFCGQQNNFLASSHFQGGTPNAPNSVYNALPDEVFPKLLGFYPHQDSVLQLAFDERVISEQTSFSGIELDTSFSDGKAVWLHLEQRLVSGETYEVTVEGLTDCYGNLFEEELRVGLPEKADSADVLISEVLFNPIDEGPDFVELYNRSNKVIDLRQFRLANGTETGQVKDVKALYEAMFLLFPHEYVVLTSHPEQLQKDYVVCSPESVVRLNLPSYNNDEGMVILLDTLGYRIDALQYSEDWHFSLFDKAELDGVSLERISFQLPTQDQDNWHSASSTSGYATPTCENSQATDAPVSSSLFELSPSVFSPDEDGYQDYLTIHYDFGEEGWVATISVFDRYGRKVKSLENNALLGASGMLTWDGVTDGNKKASIGPYILYVEAFDLNGNRKVFKQGFAVGGRL